MEKAINNVEICLNIFKHLNLEEQLKLTRVSEQFHHIIKRFLWKTTLKELQLYAFQTNVFMITNKVSDRKNCETYIYPMFLHDYNDHKILHNKDEISIILKDIKAVKDFIHINRNNIEKLQLIRELNGDGNETVEPFEFIWKYKFENLTYIDMHSLSGLSLSLKNLNLNCPKLKTLILTNCCGNDTASILKVSDGISTIASIKTLKKLIIYETCSEFWYDLNLLLSITKKLVQLNEIVLNVPISAASPEECSDVTAKELPKSSCKLLSLGLINVGNNRMSIPAMMTKSLLINFQHLQVLSLNANNVPLVIKREALEILIKLCPNLKHMSLQYCSFDDFIPIPSLETLTFVNAVGIKWQNLKAVLKQTNLQSFTSFFTRFSENFELFDIESPLQYLRIETMEYDFRDDLRKLLENNSKRLTSLKTLIWHDSTLWYEDEPLQLHFKLIHLFKNLQSLFIDMAVVDIEDIMQMECLKRLAFIENDLMDVGNMIRVFGHPSLENFTIYNRNLKCSLTNLPDKLTNFKTNLVTITIPLHILKSCAPIWLKLLAENVKLHIFCYFSNVDEIGSTFFNSLFDHDLFPERIKRVKICGFTIDRSCMTESNIEETWANITCVKSVCKLLNQTMYLEL